MRRILATLAILTTAACGSVTRTVPKTANPPLTAEQKAAGGAKPPVEIVGRTLKVLALSFQMTVSDSAWDCDFIEQPDGSARLAFQRKDTGAAMLIIPVKAEHETAKSIAEDQFTHMQDRGLAVGTISEEGKGRYAFTAVSAASDPKPVKSYLSVLPHPSVKDAYLIVVAATGPEDADAFFTEVRGIIDSIDPIR